jgi:peptidoglycan/LPS O-acetylase OafA/YrhL
VSQVRVDKGEPDEVHPSDTTWAGHEPERGPERGPAGPGGGGVRLGWLDALRGFAALAVVFQHAGPDLFTDLYRPTHRYLDAGIFGVFLFFLISGYIVPASLERRGDLRAFWTGRVFRILPLYLVVFGLALLLPRAHAGVGPAVFQHPWLSAAADGVLLQDLLGVSNGLAVSWTLCYEMVFYYLVSALFLLNLHRRSVPVAVGFAAAALGLGGVLPTELLSRGPQQQEDWVVGLALLVVLTALAAVLGGRALGIRAGVAALALLGLAVVVLNSRSAPFESMMILATMFTGTVIQRADSGQIRWRYAGACCGFVFLAGVLAGARYAGGSLNLIWTASATSWCLGFVAAWLVFGIGMLLRHRRTPGPLARLGGVSYAVYLVHVPLLTVVVWVFGDLGYAPQHRLWQEALCLAGFTLVVLLVAEALHRLVELPGQRLGRRLLGGRSGARSRRPVTNQGKPNLAGQSPG